MTITIHPITPSDRTTMAAMREQLATLKGKIGGPDSREPFDAVMERTPVGEGVSFGEAIVVGVPGWWCRPERVTPDAVMLYLHGGGYVVGSAKAYRHFVSQIAARVGVAAFVPEYRLAPERPFPAAYGDALEAYTGIAHAGYGRIALVGDSAGGGLALAILPGLTRAGNAPAAIVAISPWTDLALTGASVDDRAEARPTLLLLHGFPTSRNMFRDLIPRLADRFHLVAPDLPGFGQTKAPPRGAFDYTFDRLADVIESFTKVMGLDRYALYVFDYGAPVGLRLAMRHPERVSAIVSQNGNAYLEGFSDQWGAWEAYWREPSEANREACRPSLSPETIRDWQYGTGGDPSRLSPDGYELDIAYMARPGAEEIQLDLIGDYKSNVVLYPDFQVYLREWQPPLLAVWGRYDPAFLPAGAEAYRRDLPRAEIHLLDAGHFALETHADEIAGLMGVFLDRVTLGRPAGASF